ncbi:hypothetical protein [Yinghuangia seranimata]|uniref:hypothetical protein n=1 Tax=Yinghuangia seranimata TaxID=408067 RepID=UPI00248B85A6|nr:hypothetical protein [Yinghuangia seranimata]MDI2127811.1 hypothetical protein [Yinghuangia seranimata]
MDRIFVARVNVRSKPSSEYRTHPFSKMKNDPLEHKAAFQLLASAFGDESEILTGDDESIYKTDLDDETRTSIKQLNGKRLMFRQVSQDLAIAIDGADQWVGMATSLAPEIAACEVERLLRAITEDAGSMGDVEIYVDLAANPDDVYRNLTRLQKAGLSELALTVRRPNPGRAGDLSRILNELTVKHQAKITKIQFENDEGGLHFQSDESRDLSRKAGSGEVFLSGRSGDGSDWKSAEHPAELPVPFEITPDRVKLALITALAAWLKLWNWWWK